MEVGDGEGRSARVTSKSRRQSEKQSESEEPDYFPAGNADKGYLPITYHAAGGDCSEKCVKLN